MGVSKRVVTKGDGVNKPNKGDEVIIEYTGNLYDESKGEKADFRGNEFDSSKGRGEFKTQIGVGRVIRGWDEGVTTMTLGEKAILTISSDYAYGDRGFPNLIPANSPLVFEVELKAINGKRA